MEQTIQNYNNIFWTLISKYDFKDNNLLRKAIHSFDVAKNCFDLACSERANTKERNLAYLIGLLHDIGRFEQWIKFHTYDDTKSIDHGDASADILKSLNCKKLFNLNSKEEIILVEAIRFHTKSYLGKNKSIIKFNNILKDADAFSNVVYTANGMQQMTVSENGVTPEILNDFLSNKCLKKYSPQTKLDRSLMLTACCYYIQNTHFRRYIISSNYIDIIYETFSKYLTKEDKLVYKQAINSLKTNYFNTNATNKQ